MLTVDQALVELNNLKVSGNASTSELAKLAARVSVDAAPGAVQGTVTLLYSGSINGVSSTKYIEKMIEQGADIRVLDKTNAGKFLANVLFEKAWLDAGGSLSALYDGKTGPWAQASGRFVADTVGEVRLLGFNASNTSVFVNTELEALRNNTRITTVEGLSQAELKAKSVGDALNDLKARSANSAGLSGFKVNVSAPGIIQSVDLGAFFDRRVLDHAEYAKQNPSAVQKMTNFIRFGLTSAESYRLNQTFSKVGSKLGLAGSILVLGLALSSSANAAESGDPDKARKIMEDWALDAAGGAAGAAIGTTLVAIAAGAAALASVAVSAPVLAALAIGAAIVGGIYGSDAATQAREKYRGSGDNDELNMLEKLLAKVALPQYGLVFGTKNAEVLEGSSKADYIFGGAGNDTLKGLQGNDVLRGGAGSDTLNGGEGNDTLVGGKDNDTYQFTGSFGNDTILDADGLGIIMLDGVQLGAGNLVIEHVAGQVWETTDKKWVLTQVPSTAAGAGPASYDLILGRRASAGAASARDTITLQGWQNNQLSLNLPQTVAQTAPQLQYDLTTPTGQQAYEQSQQNSATAAADQRIYSAAQYNTGTASYLSYQAIVQAGAGDDWIEGGAASVGARLVLGGQAGDDRIFAYEGREDIDEAIEEANTVASNVPSESNRYVLDGGAGDDDLIIHSKLSFIHEDLEHISIKKVQKKQTLQEKQKQARACKRSAGWRFKAKAAKSPRQYSIVCYELRSKLQRNQGANTALTDVRTCTHTGAQNA